VPEEKSIEIVPIPSSSSQRQFLIDGPFLSKIQRNYLVSGKLSNDDWESIVETTCRILANCPDPDTGLQKNTGLALGKVQSGKTLSFTSLIALAFDNNYQLAIVLAGTNNALLNQTYQRLIDDFDLDASYEILHLKNPNRRDLNIITNYVRLKRKVIIVVLKHVGRLDRLSELICDPEVANVPMLIIDDEGDQASLNTQFRSNNQSATYSRILGLRDSSNFHSYIAYTATPQANLLISGIDALSPDYAVLVPPGPDYCGGGEFFGSNSNKYLRSIVSETDIDKLETLISDEMINAILQFIIGGVVRSLRNDLSNHSMLIHTSSRRLDHLLIERKVNQILENWQSKLSLRDDDPSKIELLEKFYLAYDDISNTLSQPLDWDEVKTKLLPELLMTEVWLVNSLPEGMDPSITSFLMKNNILIGGNMLERGVTVKGLAVTYITREAKSETNADTLEQRARWFGYKKNYLDVCRIFLTERLIGRYQSLLQHEDDFWQALERNLYQGIPIRDWPRFFRLDSDRWQLRPTRSSVANSLKFRATGWNTQRRVPINKDHDNEHNIQLLETLVKSGNYEIIKFGSVQHYLIRGESPQKIISNILAKIKMDEMFWHLSYFEEYLTRLFFSGSLQEMDVLIMNKGEFRVRAISPDGGFEPMQGRSVDKDESDPTFYPGDQYIHNDRVQLQLHRIKPRQHGGDFLALSLYIPERPIFDLNVIVRG